MTYTIKQQEALESLCNTYNKQAGTSLTPEAYLDVVVLGILNGEADRLRSEARTAMIPIADALLDSPVGVMKDVLDYAEEQTQKAKAAAAPDENSSKDVPDHTPKEPKL